MNRSDVIYRILCKYGKKHDTEEVLNYEAFLNQENEYGLKLLASLWNIDQVAVIKEKCTCGARYDRDFPNRHYWYCKGDR